MRHTSPSCNTASGLIERSGKEQCTTQLYDRRNDEVSLDEVERILI